MSGNYPVVASVVRRHRRQREAQARAVMPMIGPFLDVWDGLPNDLRQQIECEAPELSEAIAEINRAMER